MFSLIETAINQGSTVDVSYHPELGYPTEIAIGMETRIFDGGTHLLIHKLDIIPAR